VQEEVRERRPVSLSETYRDKEEIHYKVRDMGREADKEAASVIFHLDSDRPLFKRAISMSGNPMLTRPLPLAIHEQSYRTAIKAFGLENATSEERIKVLLETPAQELISKLGVSVLPQPVIDGDIIPSEIPFSRIEDSSSGYPRGTTWCNDFLLGDAQHDVSELVTSSELLTDLKLSGSLA
jgi:hypothetical protein